MSGARVLYNRTVTPSHRLMGIEWEIPRARPGQFVMLRLPHTFDPFLRRPFGIYNIIRGGIEVLYKVIGKGTTAMAGLAPGDDVDMLGPLG
ncbi:MAG: dihydroorotate dehydrogenase electron transfer subunit, partial [Deltaproteobacteria bacterium]|nr:dihydroorotate dehydrogenase electron transfer subunit [Deltaproteobacteria bacterium]